MWSSKRLEPGTIFGCLYYRPSYPSYTGNRVEIRRVCYQDVLVYVPEQRVAHPTFPRPEAAKVMSSLPRSITLFQTLTAEITCLSEQQIDAMRTATFVGMTADEKHELEQRRARIRELVQELEVLTSQKAA